MFWSLQLVVRKFASIVVQKAIPALTVGLPDHPGIAKTFGHFPIAGFVDQGQPRSPRSFGVFGSLHELGSHTMWDAGWAMHKELSSICTSNDALSQKMEMLLWIKRMGLASSNCSIILDCFSF